MALGSWHKALATDSGAARMTEDKKQTCLDFVVISASESTKATLKIQGERNKKERGERKEKRNG